MIRRRLRYTVSGGRFVLAFLALVVLARAEGKVEFLGHQLESASDFRVRTQAALALGASDDPSAVAPLCRALDDGNDSVRSAAAAALAKLKKPAGLPCLKNHGDDANPSVRSVIERSTKVLEGSAWPARPPPPGPSDTFYVAIGPVTDRTGRGDQSVGALVGAAMQDKLLSMRGYAVAPQGEPSAAAARIIRQKGLKGILLQVRVEPPRSNGNDLSVQVRMTMWTYPGKALQAEFSPKLIMSGASAGDEDAENGLIKMAIDKAIESFAEVTASTGG
jgi:hypothetical protein